MRKRFITLLAVVLIMILSGGDIVAAKRSKRAKSRAGVTRKSTRVKAGRSRAAKIARSHGSRRSRRGRVARSRRPRRYLPQASAADLPRFPSSNIPTERVSVIQGALIKLGYLEGPATGQYDDNTINALKQFQADNKLPETGHPSAHTLKKLGVPKGSNDGYAVPVGSVSEQGKKRPEQNP